MKKFTTEEIKEFFAEGIDCGQVVLLAFEEEIGIDRDLLLRIGSPFGAGFFQAKTCGAVAGAYEVLGLLYGHEKEGDFDAKNALIEKLHEFNEKFLKDMPSLVCEGILGYNLTDEKDMEVIEEKNLMMTTCPKAVERSIDVLEEMID